jgi:hypothetical protein
MSMMPLIRIGQTATVTALREDYHGSAHRIQAAHSAPQLFCQNQARTMRLAYGLAYINPCLREKQRCLTLAAVRAQLFGAISDSGMSHLGRKST